MSTTTTSARTARWPLSTGPLEPQPLSATGTVERRDRLGGVLHEYYRAAEHNDVLAPYRDYQELQQWVNEVVAAGRPVTEHTIPELEQAARLLTREVTGGGDLPGLQVA